MKLYFILSVVISLFAITFGTLDYYYEIISIKNIDLRIIYNSYFQFGYAFQWISYYFFPKLSDDSAFNIGQIIVFFAFTILTFVILISIDAVVKYMKNKK